MSERHRKVDCPGTRELELYCLDELTAAETREQIKVHVKSCPRCARKMQNLYAFYAILSEELERPVRPGLLDFCKKRACNKVKYGLLICRPIPEKDRQRGKAYLATLAFSANGDGSKTSLTDFNLSRDQIGVMLYSDPLHNEVSLFLWSKAEGGSAPCRLEAPGLFEKTDFNLAGAAKIPLTNFEYLNNRLLYFSMKKRAAGRPKLVNRVQEMLL
ncbi:MAG TPA: hypothetical protein PKY55_15570 [bacterium]|nr:MAG: hypothetical protein BWY83_01901 [bacterium ADurb.Bin478]HNY89914.1 hypothetical protein [bacterium]HOH07155.1 hypothetical protein [bacterium]HOZ21449.1 hypothetical protein [bacterium]HOZ21456.1 hypothetical protein [bacterium]